MRWVTRLVRLLRFLWSLDIDEGNSIYINGDGYQVSLSKVISVKADRLLLNSDEPYAEQRRHNEEKKGKAPQDQAARV